MAERDDKGRWLPGGESPNPQGRPSKAQEERYWQILRNKLTDDAWGQIVDMSIEQAMSGDRYARKFLADYNIGTPEQRLKLYAGEEDATLTVEYTKEWREDGE